MFVPSAVSVAMASQEAQGRTSQKVNKQVSSKIKTAIYISKRNNNLVDVPAYVSIYHYVSMYYVSIYLPVCLSVCPSVYLSIYLTIHPSIYPSILSYPILSSHVMSCHVSSCLVSSHRLVYLSIYLSVCLSIYLSLYLSIYQFKKTRFGLLSLLYQKEHKKHMTNLWFRHAPSPVKAPPVALADQLRIVLAPACSPGRIPANFSGDPFRFFRHPG